MMTYPKRGEIWLTDFEPNVGTEIDKKRPALVISNDVNNEYNSKVTVVPFSTKYKKGVPCTVEVAPDTSNKLHQKSLIRVPDIETFDKQRLKIKIGTIDNTIMSKVVEKLKIHLDIK